MVAIGGLAALYLAAALLSPAMRMGQDPGQGRAQAPAQRTVTDLDHDSPLPQQMAQEEGQGRGALGQATHEPRVPARSVAHIDP